MTRTQKIEINRYLREQYASRNIRRIRHQADGWVTAYVDRMPNTNQAGRILCGNQDQLLRYAWAQTLD